MYVDRPEDRDARPFVSFTRPHKRQNITKCPFSRPIGHIRPFAIESPFKFHRRFDDNHHDVHTWGFRQGHLLGCRESTLALLHRRSRQFAAFDALSTRIGLTESPPAKG